MITTLHLLYLYSYIYKVNFITVHFLYFFYEQMSKENEKIKRFFLGKKRGKWSTKLIHDGAFRE